jgi:RNA polymerase subunit RPABC4/transcription elongation factor Spt4
MAKSKACKLCKTIVESGEKCPNCGSKEVTEGFKGRIVVLNPDKSELPSKAEVKVALAEKTKSKPETVIIKNILSSFGSQSFKIVAFAYDSKEDLEKAEGKQAEPEAPAEEAAPAEQPAAEEKPAEAPKEESKEETKPEEKKE